MRCSLSSAFREAVDGWLDNNNPPWNAAKREYQGRESALIIWIALILQWRCCTRRRGHTELGSRYRSTGRHRCDIALVAARAGLPRLHIELEWQKKGNDSFLTSSLDDFWRLLKRKPARDHGGFLALSLSNRWDQFPRNWKEYKSPVDLPIKKGRISNLMRFWNDPKLRRHKDRFRFHLKKHCAPRRPKGDPCNVLLLTYATDRRLL